MAILTAVLLLFLVSGLSIFVFQNAATQRQIATYSKKELVALSVAESAVEQVLSWFSDSARLPQDVPSRAFFEERFCKETVQKPDYYHTVSLFEHRIDLRLYKSEHKDGICAIEAKVRGGVGVKVDLSKNPMAPITAAVQGVRPGEKPKTDFVHWGKSRALGDADLDPVDLEKLKPFIKRFGRYLVISPAGRLEENGIEIGPFDQVFGMSKGVQLVFIDTREGYSATAPLKIAASVYKGYFYFTGDIHIVGYGTGRSVLAYPPPPPTSPLPEALNDIDLDGFFYTPGKMIFTDLFRVYGALYAGSGFYGEGANLLHVWYNHHFQSGLYEGVVPLIRIPGTWRTM